MINLFHVYKTYPQGHTALKNIQLKIDRGEFVFLTGPSGAGKTTLFRLLTAYEKPTSGQVSVAGFEVDKISPVKIPFLRRQIGVIYQDFKLLKDRSVYDNVSLPLQIMKERSAVIDRRVTEVLERVGLRHKAEDLPEFLSGGEQQRAAIARAIVHRPGLLIADEPTGNLDSEMANEIMKFLEEISAHGTTVFIATHDLQLVGNFRKRHIKLKNGALEGDSNDIARITV